MKTFLISFAAGLVCHVITAPGQAGEFQLPHLGTFRPPSGAWKILEEKTRVNSAFVVTLLRNDDNEDMLSFAVYEKSGSEINDMLTLLDTAHELFPDGRVAALTPTDHPYLIHSLRWSVTNVLDRSQQVLEYSFVAEHEIPEKNRLAHGYVLIGDVTVFVQHTSGRPVTSELALVTSSTVLRRLLETSDASNLKPILRDDAELKTAPNRGHATPVE